MLANRIIACLDVNNGKVVKGVKFKQHKIVGDIVELARKYSEDGADELVFYDITASSDKKAIDINWVKRVSEQINIPFTVAGGIDSIDKARRIFNAGADKVSLNSPAINRPDLINELSKEFGSQSIVIGIDSKYQNGDYYAWRNTGCESKAEKMPLKTMDWIKEVQRRGAGEIVLNCMSSDGTKNGYDIKQLEEASKLAKVPLIASGGAGSMGDFKSLFKNTPINSALAAGIFHREEVCIKRLKLYLKMSNIEVRI